MPTLLHTTHLAIGYNHARQPRVIADAINISLNPGEMACLIGPNGAGKSTLMRTLAGMQPPLAGQVLLGDDNLHSLEPAELAKRLAVVLTERVDVGNLSAYALVALGRHPYTDWRGRLTTTDEAVVQRSLAQVGATPLAARPVNELSDGERQRVMIARALAQEPEVLILDEPTAFLDLPRRVETLHLLGTLARTTRCAVLLSTHDLDLAFRVADRLWLLPTGGKLLAGLPEELALDGSLARTFQNEGVEFDPVAGTFKLHRHSCGPISLHASGLPQDDLRMHWTARALERIGFQVLPDDSEQPYQVIVNGGWQVITPSGKREFATLSEVIEYVKSA